MVGPTGSQPVLDNCREHKENYVFGRNGKKRYRGRFLPRYSFSSTPGKAWLEGSFADTAQAVAEWQATLR